MIRGGVVQRLNDYLYGEYISTNGSNAHILCYAAFLGSDILSTVAAISTPDSPGGIAVIRISGDDAIVVAERVFAPMGGKKISDMDGYTCAYGIAHDRLSFHVTAVSMLHGAFSELSSKTALNLPSPENLQNVLF